MQGWWAASYVVLWLLVVMLAFVVVALARQVGTLHLRLGPRGALEIDDEGPPLGELAPPFNSVAISGARVDVGGPGRAQLLLFVSPGCKVCDEVLPGIDAVAAVTPFEPLVVTDLDESETKLRFESRDVRAPIVPGREVASAYQVPGTPYAVVLDERGFVQAKGTVNNLEQLEGLLDTAQRRIPQSEPVKQ